MPPGQPGTPWQDAADSLTDWLAEAILLPDGRPALYVYEQLTPALGSMPGLLQRGLIGAVRLVPREAGIVQPHEAVAPGPVTGRLAADGGDPGQPGADLPALRRGGQGR